VLNETIASTPSADVALLLEGTYPYVAGGVSSWVDQVLAAHAERRFALLHIGPYPGAYRAPVYTLPKNVVGMMEIYCRGGEADAPTRRRATSPPPKKGRPKVRVIDALRQLHLQSKVDDALLSDLSAGDLTVGDLLHGSAAFQLCRELYASLGNGAPFMDFFWHFRAMHVPLLRILAAPCPKASLLHAVSTGYAGLVGSVNSVRTGVPLVLTEHGLYARERELELARASWIQDHDAVMGARRASPLRRFWSHYFRMLSRIAYRCASRIVTLSEDNRAKQLMDGADPLKCAIVPNGVARTAAPPPTDIAAAPRPRMRVGFVGRVVPIKDVLTLIRGIGLASRQVDLECWIVGPDNEDPVYAARCRSMVQALGLDEKIKFLGAQQVAEIYPQLDVLVLTSFSEGQPLVILEAFAHGLPVVATDVGACRELIEGGDADRRLGRAGIVTRVASPADTAAALVDLARRPALRQAMGAVGAARVATRYQLEQVVAIYDSLYSTCMVQP
jgi:glycosyltransferase involved in cell wall biosynthesis